MRGIRRPKTRIGAAFLLAAMLMIGAFASAATVSAAEGEIRVTAKPGDLCGFGSSNPYTTFHVPTQVYSVNGDFFLADAYHNQMLFTDNYRNAPEYWGVMGGNMFRPHAIASDGTIYMVVDTDNNRVNTYVKTETGFLVVQCFDQVGIRPHYVEYDAATGQFYVWSSMTGTMYIYRREADSLNVTLAQTAYIKDLDGCYTRSFTIDGDKIYLPSMGRSAIYVVDKGSFKVSAVYPVCADLGGMVQVRHEQNYYYLVTSTDVYGDASKATIVRSTSLAGFTAGGYEDIRGKFPELEGVPYYISHLEDGHYYTPVMAGKPYIVRFDIVEDEITNVVSFKY